MSYEQALEAAGAKVIASEYFGSYQGDWFALVDYKGQRGKAPQGRSVCGVSSATHARAGGSPS